MLKIGYLVPEFPSQTHVFFWREVVALRACGHEVHRVSTSKPPADSCRHAFADGARRKTLYRFPPKLGDALAWISRPAGVVRVVRYVAGLKECSLKRKLKVLAMSLCATRFVAHARRNGIQHLHSHSFADSAHVAAMVWLLGRIPYSLTLHGSLENYGTDHSAKVRDATCITTDGNHLVHEIGAATGYPGERILSTCMGLDTSTFMPEPGGSAAGTGTCRC